MASTITIKQLRVFTQVSQHGTLSEAAKCLFISKAAVSIALSDLEKQLGHSVFDRINNRLVINQQGIQLLPLADEIIARHAEIESLGQRSNPFSGSIKLGASQTIGNHLLPYMLASFSQQTGNFSTQKEESQLFVDSDIRITNNETLCRQVLEYKVDVGLTEGEVKHPDLVTLPFAQDEMLVICPKQSLHSGKRNIDLAQLSGQRWILRETGSGSRDYFLNHLAPSLTHWQEAYQFSSTSAIINGVSAGLGYSCMSNHALDSSRVTDNIGKVYLREPLLRQYSIVLHKQKYRTPLLNHFIEFVKNWHTKKVFSI
ncbi:LysR family transcriptional regulator [Vibrio astriarenae]|uniref:LysR family transcriptional regulator n=1 Tax=Vibrio astriarenae TaxID=1481923 RepID=A0A7Z2YF93_9VIBR|nr:LysR substrate-binding domain-containing protein [Vibrio astriarenae]QIA65161.1 LysR family transcriptional regulator [Vibrio astriarenae]